MPSHIMKHIFDPFFNTKGPQLTGLGMSISYGIITRHEGTISVDSKEGSGTTFAIKFPIREPERLPQKYGQEALITSCHNLLLHTFAIFHKIY